MLLQHPITAQFLSGDLLFVLVRDESFFCSLICNVREMFVQNPYLLLLASFLGGGSRDTYWNRYVMKLIKK